MCATAGGRRTRWRAARTLAHLAVVASALALARPAEAQACRNLRVSRPIAFGAYNPLSGATRTATGQVTYRCQRRVSPAISLSAGTSGDVNARTMRSPAGDSLGYNIYTSASYQTVWGTTPIPVPSGGTRTVTFYGRVPGSQPVGAGSYADTIWVRLDF